ncbi:uncharacterized protein LOC116130120 [Pistacia vera]|uniref:uncharacterized protein LOC116130099 n=1 Tax=Pistacia vera TaxID=55513 RepID=UPI001263B929|nr:uncharacterized protein LOC116130099 [Pistacia vera]XP_031271742.1 uncharacterized protein LOC116130120 [Pistacia vera]
MATTLNFLLRPLCISTTSSILSKFPLRRATHLSSVSTPSLLFSQSVSFSRTPTRAFTPTASLSQLQEEQGEDQDIDYEIEESEAEHIYEEAENVGSDERKSFDSGKGVELPTLTVKEKKELASYAHSLGKKLTCQIVGKGGVTENVVASFIENLESNELLKIKVLGTCPGEFEDVVKQLEEATGSVVVGQIGRTVIIYRPSLTKLELEEKKRQARRVYVRRESKFKPTLPNVRVPRLSGRGRRGSSRF